MLKMIQKQFNCVTGVFLLTLLSVSLTGCMHNAARKGDIKAMKFCLDLGADPDSLERLGTVNFPFGSIDTPLILAARAGHKDMVEYLIERGADVNRKGEAWYTPIFCAAWNGDDDMVIMLLNSGAKIEPFGAHNSALNSAVYRGHIKVAEILLAHGANVHRKGINGATLLHDAVTKGHVDMVKFLLSKGSDVNTKAIYGTTPLHIANDHGDVQIGRILLEHGADPTLDPPIPQSFIDQLRE